MNKMNKCYTSKTTRNKITVLLRVETLKISIGGTSRKVRFVSIKTIGMASMALRVVSLAPVEPNPTAPCKG